MHYLFNQEQLEVMEFSLAAIFLLDYMAVVQTHLYQSEIYLLVVRFTPLQVTLEADVI